MSQMAREIAEIPAAAARLLDLGRAPITEVADRLREHSPNVLVTVGRGSSDHAATGLAYGLGMMSGILPASYPPSLASIVGQVPRMEGQLALAISQSGQSRDIIAASQALIRGGATLVVLTNRTDGPLAQIGGQVIDIHAGPELAVAATKSFVNSVLAGAMLFSDWMGDDPLRQALSSMPEALDAALARGTADLVPALSDDDRLMVLGRGPSLGIAAEVALKAMELCGMTALAYSTAEVRHGPMQILRDGYPVLDLTRGPPLEGTVALSLPGAEPVHPQLDPLLDLVPLYVALEAAARARGFDPDAPDRLKKETVTL